MIKKGLLKGLCIFGLTLLPISFSNAVNWNDISCYEYEGLSTNVVYGNTILTFNNGNFSTQRGSESIQNVMWLTPNNFGTNQGQTNLSSAFGYIDGLPYIYAGTTHTSQAINQGFAQDFCYESLDNFNLSTFGTNTNCNNEPISTFLSNKNLIGGGYCYPDSTNNYLYAPFTYCFYDSDYAYCFKIVSYTNSPNWKILNLSGTIGLSTPLNVSRLQNVSWSPSPFINTPTPPTPSIPPYERGEGTYTNQDIIDGYNAMGLTDGFCYGGFPITDIFNNGENPDSRVGYQWGSGASILDIWDNYKTAYNNDYISFLRTFYISYENKNYNAFYGYPKSLYSFFNQWSVIDLSSVGFNSYMSDFTITNIWEYCNLKFNSNPNATYTGNSWKPGFSFDNKDVVNNKGRFDFSGNSLYFSGSLSGFNSPSDFFGSLNSIFQNGLGSLKDIRQPLIPSYIIIFMLAIIFIRIISH